MGVGPGWGRESRRGPSGKGYGVGSGWCVGALSVPGDVEE